MDLINDIAAKGSDVIEAFFFMKIAIYLLIANAVVTWAYVLLSRKVNKDE